MKKPDAIEQAKLVLGKFGYSILRTHVRARVLDIEKDGSRFSAGVSRVGLEGKVNISIAVLSEDNLPLGVILPLSMLKESPNQEPLSGYSSRDVGPETWIFMPPVH